MKTRRIVAIAEQLEHAEDNSVVRQRTAVFNETSTLKEVFDWLRGKSSDEVGGVYIGTRWWDAKVSIHEDEATKEDHPLKTHSFTSMENTSDKIPF